MVILQHMTEIAGKTSIATRSDAVLPQSNVWLDDSLQGWDFDRFDESDRNGNVLIVDEIARDREPHDFDKRILVLGRYYPGSIPRRSTPDRDSRIVIYPNAIRLVATSSRFAHFFTGTESERYDALFQLVLVHELAHWFTLDPGVHRSRLSAPTNIQSHPTDPTPGTIDFTEIAETVAELFTWIVANTLALDDKPRALALLRCQYYLKIPAASHHYQLYACWLAITGLIDTPEDLQGESTKDLGSELIERRIALIKEWLTADTMAPDPTLAVLIVKARYDLKTAKERHHPEFPHANSSYRERASSIWSHWIKSTSEGPLPTLGDDHLDVLML